MTGPNAGSGSNQPTQLGGVDDRKQLKSVQATLRALEGDVGQAARVGPDANKTPQGTPRARADQYIGTVFSRRRTTTNESEESGSDSDHYSESDDDSGSYSKPESPRSQGGGGGDEQASVTVTPRSPQESPRAGAGVVGGANPSGGGGDEQLTVTKDSSNLHDEIAFGEEEVEDGNIKKRVRIFDASDPVKVVNDIDEELKKKLTEDLNKLKKEATKKPKNSVAENEEGDNPEINSKLEFGHTENIAKLKSGDTAHSSANTAQASDSAGDEKPDVAQTPDEQQPKKVDEVDEQGPLEVTRTDCAYLKNDRSKLGFALTDKQREIFNSQSVDSNNLKVLNTISKLTYDDYSKKYTNHTFYLDKKGMEQYEKIHEKIHEKIVEEIGSGGLTKDKISEAFERAIVEMQNTGSSIDKNKPTLGQDKLDDQDIKDINEIISHVPNNNQKAIQIMEMLIVGGHLKISSAEVIRQVDKDGKRKDDKAEIKISCGYEGTVNLARKEGGKVDRFFIDQNKQGVEKFEYLGIFESDLETHHSDYPQKNWDYKKCEYTFKEDDVVKKFERERYEVFKENLNIFKTLLRSGCSALSFGCIGLFKFNEKTKNQKPKRSTRLTSSRFIKNSTTQAPRGNQQAPNAHGGDANSGNVGGVSGGVRSGDGKGRVGLITMERFASPGSVELTPAAAYQRSKMKKAIDQGGGESPRGGAGGLGGAESPEQEVGAARGGSSDSSSPRPDPNGPDGTHVNFDFSRSSSASRS